MDDNRVMRGSKPERFLKLKKMFMGKSGGNRNVPQTSKPREFSTPTI